MRVYVCHHSPGRVRLRAPDARRKPDVLKHIATIASKLDGVRSTVINPTTGSVLIRYARGALKSLGVLATAFVDSGLPLQLVDVLAETEGAAEFGQYSDLARGLAETLLSADTVVRSATHNQLDLKILLPVTAGIAGLAALRNSSIGTPLWLTLMIFAFSSFVALNQLEDSDPESTNHTRTAISQSGQPHAGKNDLANDPRS